jgi:hypothetical protein
MNDTSSFQSIKDIPSEDLTLGSRVVTQYGRGKVSSLSGIFFALIELDKVGPAGEQLSEWVYFLRVLSPLELLAECA